jgi:hypothetical protein
VIKNNGVNGLGIVTAGTISIKNTSVNSQSTGYGASLNNTTGTGGVTINNSQFTGNKLEGLIVRSNGAILITSVSAFSNQVSGAIFNNSSGVAGVTINGGTTSDPNSFSFNKYDGLKILTKGMVSVTNVQANMNDDLSGFSDGIEISTSLGNVTLTNIKATNNGAAGISVIAPFGTISVTNVETASNGSYGAYLDNSGGLVPKTVTVKNFSSSSTGGYHGLFIHSAGNVAISSINISFSNMAGVYVDNTPGTAVSSITINAPAGVMNKSSSNIGAGVVLLSDGSVTISQLDASGNDSSGIFASNDSGSSGIILSNVISSGNGLTGLRLYSKGAISVTNVASVANGLLNSSGWGASLNNSSGSAAVTVFGSKFNDNYSGGLYVNSNGAVVITNSVANGNQNDQGFDLSSSKPVSIISVSGFRNSASSNLRENVRIQTNADVVIQNLVSSINTNGNAVQINTTGGTGKVTVSGLEISSSNKDGLNILTNGIISVSNSNVTDSWRGIYLDNSTGSGSVLLNNVKSTGNQVIGLWIITNGNTSLDKVKILSNVSAGSQMDINNPASSLSITRSNFDYNGLVGLTAHLGGNVTLNNVSASYNTGGAIGMNINNSSGTGTVTILSTLGLNNFNNNQGSGLYIWSAGAFKGSGINANDNGLYGTYIFNSLGTGGATLTGGSFQRNNNTGLYVFSTSDITVTGVTVTENGKTSDVSGIYLVNNGNITLANSITSGNGKEGVYASGGSSSTILISKTFFFGNNRFLPNDNDPNILIGSGTLKIIR